MRYELNEDIKLMCLKSPEGPMTAGVTFDKLESALSSLKGRKFYGLFKIENGVETYLSCTQIEEGDEPEKNNFFRDTIPRGIYERDKLDNWEKKWDGGKIEGLPELFQSMRRKNKGNIDEDRFSVEFYRSRKELILMVPLK